MRKNGNMLMIIHKAADGEIGKTKKLGLKKYVLRHAIIKLKNL
jgi:hypothetical protein